MVGTLSAHLPTFPQMCHAPIPPVILDIVRRRSARREMNSSKSSKFSVVACEISSRTSEIAGSQSPSPKDGSLSPVPIDLTPTAIPVSDNPALAKGVDLLRKTAREVGRWVR